MNRILPVLLTLIILAGCAGPAQETTTQTTIQTTSPTESTSLTTEPTTTTTTSQTTTTTTSSQNRVTVVDVVDGDTVEIQYTNGTTETVRLLGVDTPEVHTGVSPDEFEGVPDTESGRSCLRTEGEDASEFASERLLHKEVRLEFDRLADRRGTFGRLLAYIYVEGENFNYQLVAEGYARVYDSEFTESDRFYGAESDAQASDIGVWRCTAISTATTTATSTSSDSGELVVVNIHADAAGNDHENENDEYIVFENQGDSTLEMGEWTVEDEADHTYTVPSGFSLAPGDQVTLYTGTGMDTDSELYWGSDSAIWNNGGDTILVFDASGQTRLEKSYS